MPLGSFILPEGDHNTITPRSWSLTFSSAFRSFKKTRFLSSWLKIILSKGHHRHRRHHHHHHHHRNRHYQHHRYCSRCHHSNWRHWYDYLLTFISPEPTFLTSACTAFSTASTKPGLSEMRNQITIDNTNISNVFSTKIFSLQYNTPCIISHGVQSSVFRSSVVTSTSDHKKANQNRGNHHKEPMRIHSKNKKTGWSAGKRELPRRIFVWFCTDWCTKWCNFSWPITERIDCDGKNNAIPEYFWQSIEDFYKVL